MKTNAIKKQSSKRNNLMAMIHIAAAHLDIKSHSEEYRDWLESVSGSRSCKNLADDQLAAVVATLKQKGLLLKKPTGSAPNRPTNAQWAKVETLARQLPLRGAKTPHFSAWVKKVTKLESPRFLTKATMRDVIAGLEKWVAYEKRKSAKPTVLNTNHQPQGDLSMDSKKLNDIANTPQSDAMKAMQKAQSGEESAAMKLTKMLPKMEAEKKEQDALIQAGLEKIRSK